MNKIELKAPAKINLTLEITEKREDGYHNIKSIMHTIDLHDYITIEVEKDFCGKEITINGNSDEIPYDETNLAWKAANAFLEEANICQAKVAVYITKNIPVAAGLAGGSTDAAAVLKGLNEIYDNILSEEQIGKLCSELGSDLNFCLRGGCAICTSRGEKILPLPYLNEPISIVKPRKLKISAKEAFEEYDKMDNKINKKTTDSLISLILRGKIDIKLLNNDLEKPLCNKYFPIANMKKFIHNSQMTGSGPCFFILDKKFDVIFDKTEFIVFEDLKTISKGVEVIRKD